MSSRRISPRARLVLGGGVAAVVVAILVAGTVTTKGGGKHPGKPVTTPHRSPVSSAAPTIAGPVPPKSDQALWRGSNAAPVTLVEFGDYQCPSCGHFARDTEPALLRLYVDTGVVRLIWRDFPWIGTESTRAAIAGRAAGRQRRFWQFHNALYAHQFPEKSGHLTADYLRGIAQRLGLDLARFDADRRDPALAKAVQDDYDFGQGLGVPGTPAFLINGTPFFGDQPLSAFKSAIDKAKAQS